jgi:hypothetical protein
MATKRETGLIDKFRVQRTDGSDAPGQKHDGCAYFVLDLTHDPHAIPALATYARSCAADYPALAKDLKAVVKRERQIQAVGRALDTERLEKR